MKKNSFIKNIIILMFSQIIIKIAGFIYKIYLTNKHGFGDAGNAIYSAGFQVYAILLTLSSIGIPNAISKMVSSKCALNDHKGAYRILKIAVMLFSFIGFTGSVFLYLFANPISNKLLQIPEAEISLQLLAPSIFMVSVASVFRGYFNGVGKIKTTAKSQNIEQIFKTIITIVIVEFIAKISNFNTTYMVAASTVATTLATIFSTIYLYVIFKKNKNNIWGSIKGKYNQEKCSTIIKNILVVTIPITLSSFLSVATKSVDSLTIVRILKTYMVPEEAKRLYGILSGKIDTLVFLPLSFNIALSTTLIPTISSLMEMGQKKETENKIKISLLISILIGLPCTAFMMVYAKEILRLLFPNATQGALMLQISSIEIIFIVLIQTINGALQGIGKAKVCVKILSLGLVLKTILNIVLLYREEIGIFGAIISSIISHLVILLISTRKLIKEGNFILNINKEAVKVIIATVVATIISYLSYLILNNNVVFSLSLILAIFIGGLVYAIIILLLKILPKSIFYLTSYGEKGSIRL